ncbi:inner membrane protein YiaA [Massilia jejuensis]|uniref:Inner membrane protein YiaA n=1 Tax=Massilia jejuensis TaxID=648894 RepID=A0ABW0PG64_9BURK
MTTVQRPTAAFVGASWGALCIGVAAFLLGLWNAQMQLNEKGYYLSLLLHGLFAAISLQKSVRDRSEGIAVTGLYFSLCWFSLFAVIGLLAAGLWNAELQPSEKGFYAMSFVLSLFAVVAVQKNVRDLGADQAPAPATAPGHG